MCRGLLVRSLLLTATLHLTLALAHHYLTTSNLEDDEPSDFEVWSAIVSSIAQWREWRKRKELRPHNPWRGPQVGRIKREASVGPHVVCYRHLGCFSDQGPFEYLGALPDPPLDIGSKYTLYTRKQPMIGESLHYENRSSLYFSHFNGSNPVKVVIHGFGSSGKRAWVKQMTEALLFMEDVNVIVVDWEKGAALPHYVQAAANTRLVGKELVQLIRMINFERGTTAQDFHIIGFSLGAHVAGFAGMDLKNLSRITGLDPAAPLFEGYDLGVKLDPSDANFVDIIHSSGDSILRGGLGAFEAMGHVDFYPNGGKVQIGCNSVFIGAISDIFYRNWQSLCNHRRSYRFFIESVIPSCVFPAVACDSYEKFAKGECFPCTSTSCSHMGYYADKSNVMGKFFLRTRETEPFCANQYKLIVNNTLNQGKTWGKFEFTFVGQDGQNETFQLSNESDEIADEQPFQGIVVPHPNVRNITHVMLKYTKYRGWIYNGLDYWKVDKVQIMDSYGTLSSYCNHGTPLKDGEPRKLRLAPGDCQTISPTQRLARLIWKVVGEPVSGPDPRPPQLVWKIMLNDGERYNWEKR